MSTSVGFLSSLLVSRETAYGVKAAVNTYNIVPYVSNSFGPTRDLIASNVLSLSQDPDVPTRGRIAVAGQLIIPADDVNLGIWLTSLLGDPITTGSGPYVHEFRSGKLTRPSLSVEIGYHPAPDFRLFTGVQVNSMTIPFQTNSSPVDITLDLIGKDLDYGSNSIQTTANRAINNIFSEFQGQVSFAGSALANITSANITYTNNLTPVTTIRADDSIDGTDLAIGGLTGTISARHDGQFLRETSRLNTPIELSFSYQMLSGQKVEFTAHKVFLPEVTSEITGPGGVQTDFNFIAARNDDTTGRMLTVKLTNDIPDYAISAFPLAGNNISIPGAPVPEAPAPEPTE